LFDSWHEEAAVDFSFEERSAWISPVAQVAVFGGYFWAATRMIYNGVTDITELAG
jgi:hypothetical protein